MYICVCVCILMYITRGDYVCVYVCVVSTTTKMRSGGTSEMTLL